MVPEKKITVEDVKYVLSSHYQGTPYDPYAAYGDKSWKGAYRSIGVNRTDFLSVIQMRPDHKGDNGILQWIAFASNAFNVLVPFYTDVTSIFPTQRERFPQITSTGQAAWWQQWQMHPISLLSSTLSGIRKR